MDEMTKEVAPRIVIDHQIRSGKPVIKGTRVPVELVLAKLGGGMSIEQVSNEYDITLEDVRAVLQYAAHVISLEEIRIVA
jgi:uncharacterized protein (DUF433 family)